MMKNRKGFTLVELLIVMAVIAALMGALVPVAINAINHANATRIAENLRSLVTQVQQYAYSEHTLPSTTTLATSGSVSGNLSGYSITPNSLSGTTTTFWVKYDTGSQSLAKAVTNVWSGVVATGTTVGASGVIVKYW